MTQEFDLKIKKELEKRIKDGIGISISYIQRKYRFSYTKAKEIHGQIQ